jgi:hypothetical protein
LENTLSFACNLRPLLGSPTGQLETEGVLLPGWNGKISPFIFQQYIFVDSSGKIGERKVHMGEYHLPLFIHLATY